MPLWRLERIVRGQRETREKRRNIDRLWKDWQDTRFGAMADGLSQTNKMARRAKESYREN